MISRGHKNIIMPITPLNCSVLISVLVLLSFVVGESKPQVRLDNGPKPLMVVMVNSLYPQKSRPTSISHKLPLCNKWNLWAPDIGRVFYGDSVCLAMQGVLGDAFTHGVLICTRIRNQTKTPA